MFRKVFNSTARICLTGKSRTGKLHRASRSLSQFGLETLEFRSLPSFAAPVSYNVGTQADGFVPNAAPVNVATGDFNGDGKVDMVVAHKADNSVNIFLGNGNGTFQPAVRYAVGEAIEGSVFVGDFNGDGKLDLFLPGDINSADHPIILLGNGDGTFQPRIDSSSFAVSGTYARGWAVGDFNGDGKLDVVATTPSLSADSGGVVVLLGNGDGTFQPGIANPPPLLHYSRWVTTGDFNGDGKLDLAVADGQGAGTTTGSAELTILLGNGDGTFRLGGHYASPGTPGADTLNPEDVFAADLNKDGKLDVIVSDYDQNINVFLGNGDGSFQPAVGYTTGEYPRSVGVVDVNGDGKVDLVVNNIGIGPGGAEFQKEGAQPGTVAVMLGNGDGTFQAPIQYTPIAFYPGWTAVADFNGDGLPDLAVTQVSAGHTVDVMLNQPNTANQPPTVTGVSPATGLVGGGSVVTITGTNFTGTTQVLFGSVGATTFTVNSDTSITATAPAEAAGPVDISVYNAGPSATSAADIYTYVISSSAETWTGLGTTSNWSEAANWSAGVVPGPGTTVIFNGTSSANSIVDSGFAGTVAAVQINSGYTGTIGLNQNLTVMGPFTQQAGTYNANGRMTAVTGTTTVSGGSYLAATNTQALTGGLIVSGGIFAGSTGTVSTASVTLSSGTLDAPSTVLTVVGGNFTYTGGTFNAEMGTVSYAGNVVSPTVAVGTGKVRFYNFQDALTGGYPAGLTITGTLTVSGTFTWKTGSGIINGNIEAQGNVDDQNHGGTGNPYFTLDGIANQTLEDTSGGGGGFLRTLTINKPGGSVSLTCNPLVFSNFTVTAGTVNTGTHELLVGGQGPLSAATGVSIGNIEIDGASVTVSSPSLQVANLTFAASSDKLTAPVGKLFVSGNWTNSVGANFAANGGTVVFDGVRRLQLLTSGGKAFNNLTIAAGAIVELEDSLTVLGLFTNLGTFLRVLSS
jgi:hypothetical protein